ncbi:MAG: metallophosphoesterase [Bacillota bacterium]|nr:metallophosphoesterase [Bacillota bacterium]
MDNITIVYFSDLLYGELTPYETIKNTFNKIKKLNPDIIIFGGDLFDQNYSISKKDYQTISSLLDSMEAPLGKYAVYGETDLEESHKTKVDDLFFKNNIEILDNTSIRVGNRSKKGIRFIGITNTQDIPKILESTSSEEFNILITHQPDSLLKEEFSLSFIDYALAGHSHSTQITYPILGGYESFLGSQSINRSHQSPTSFPYYITSGIGCTNTKFRFNATPEVCYFVLRKTN